MATFEDVRAIAGGWPEVVEAPSYHGMPALKVRGRPFCRLWAPSEHRREHIEGTEVLVVFCDLDEKPLLLDAHAAALFSTPHYEGHPALLVRLAEVDRGLLTELLADSYRARAPKRLARELDG